MATNALVNQLTAEGVVSGNAKAEINQLVVEALLLVPTVTQVNQVVIEAVQGTQSGVDVNQLTVEAITVFVPPVTAIMGGFALIASVIDTPDPASPAVTLAAPLGSTVGQTTAFYWSAVGVTFFRITGTNGYDSGLLSASSNSGILYAPAFDSSGTYRFTIFGLDSSETAQVQVTIVVTVQS
jgi:hypothetical protein